MSRPAADVYNKDERMERKPILMPPSLINHTDKLARKASKKEKRTVSFAEIVRRALRDYDPNTEKEGDEVLEALADALIKSTQDTAAYLKRVEKKLNATHADLEEHKYVIGR